MTSDLLLDVRDLKVHFPAKRAGLFGPPRTVQAVDGVSLAITRGATLGLVGESGSGKTTTAQAIMRLVPTTSGHIELDGQNFLELDAAALIQARRKIQMIFQDPYSSLNPRRRAGAIVREPMDRMNIRPPDERDGRVAELFQVVGLRPEQRALFPHQFSGGQRQRIGIARALATEPKLLVCDEPVSALDVAIQAQVLNLLRRLQSQLGLSMLFISHDLGVVRHVCQDIAVMYLGRIVEQADRVSLFRRPLHPYTSALISSVPSARVGSGTHQQRIKLEGDPPSPIDLPRGCSFAGRCPYAVDRCRQERPDLRPLPSGRRVACHLIGPDERAPDQHPLTTKSG
ncbi:MAG: oligopeptide/dipeptide ABC transporter ATP-binding protein [Hyphomicrobiaceae bacterium]